MTEQLPGRSGDPRPSVEDFIISSLDPRMRVSDVAPLEGDASDRSYFRVQVESSGADDLRSLIVMRLSRPSESGELPFINIGNYIRGLGLGAPEVYAYNGEWGMLALEDCGDVTLQEAFSEYQPEEMEGFYFSAVDDLITMQTGGTREQRAKCQAFTYSFDEERFVWELNFTVEHWLSRLLGNEITSEDNQTMQILFGEIARTMLAQELCFTHRDYHSRNLMVQRGGLRILDYQDARLGPPQYDLASLLKDSYVTLSPGWEERLVERYLIGSEAAGGALQDKDRFMRLYHTTCLQRNLKAIGTFASQKTLRGNDYYLQYIPPTLSYVVDNIKRHEYLSPLGEILFKYLPENLQP